MGISAEMQPIKADEIRLVNGSALEEVNQIIESLKRSGTHSGQYLAYGGQLVLEILGLKEVGV